MNRSTLLAQVARATGRSVVQVSPTVDATLRALGDMLRTDNHHQAAHAVDRLNGDRQGLPKPRATSLSSIGRHAVAAAPKSPANPPQQCPEKPRHRPAQSVHAAKTRPARRPSKPAQATTKPTRTGIPAKFSEGAVQQECPHGLSRYFCHLCSAVSAKVKREEAQRKEAERNRNRPKSKGKKGAGRTRKIRIVSGGLPGLGKRR